MLMMMLVPPHHAPRTHCPPPTHICFPFQVAAQRRRYRYRAPGVQQHGVEPRCWRHHHREDRADRIRSEHQQPARSTVRPAQRAALRRPVPCRALCCEPPPFSRAFIGAVPPTLPRSVTCSTRRPRSLDTDGSLQSDAQRTSTGAGAGRGPGDGRERASQNDLVSQALHGTLA